MGNAQEVEKSLKPEDLGVPIFRHFQTKPYVFIDFCHFYIG